MPPATEGLLAGVRRLCLALPEVTEGLTHGGESWFVRRRSFRAASYSNSARTSSTRPAGRRSCRVLDIEWPAVRNNLRYRMDRNG
jgi:hypothetical protein